MVAWSHVVCVYLYRVVSAAACQACECRQGNQRLRSRLGFIAGLALLSIESSNIQNSTPCSLSLCLLAVSDVLSLRQQAVGDRRVHTWTAVRTAHLLAKRLPHSHHAVASRLADRCVTLCVERSHGQPCNAQLRAPCTPSACNHTNSFLSR